MLPSGLIYFIIFCAITYYVSFTKNNDNYYSFFGEVDMITVTYARFCRARKYFTMKKGPRTMFSYFCFFRDFLIGMVSWYLIRQVVLIYIHGDMQIQDLSISFLTWSLLAEWVRDLVFILVFIGLGLEDHFARLIDNGANIFRKLWSMRLYRAVQENVARDSINIQSIYIEHIRRMAYLGGNGANNGAFLNIVWDGEFQVAGLANQLFTFALYGGVQILALQEYIPKVLVLPNGYSVPVVEVFTTAAFLFWANNKNMFKPIFDGIQWAINNWILGEKGLLNKVLPIEEEEGQQQATKDGKVKEE